MSNFVDYGNMTSLMSALKTAIDNAGGGGGKVVWAQVPSAQITSLSDIKVGDMLYFSYSGESVPGSRHKIKFSAANSASATISTAINTAPYGCTGGVVVYKTTSTALLALTNPGTGSGGCQLGSFTLQNLTRGYAVCQPGIDADKLGTTSGTDAYSLYIRSGGTCYCTVSNLIVYRAKVQ